MRFFWEMTWIDVLYKKSGTDLTAFSSTEIAVLCVLDKNGWLKRGDHYGVFLNAV